MKNISVFAALFIFSLFFVASHQQCEENTLPVIGPLQVAYVPELRSESVPPAFWTDDNGTSWVHFELWSFAARNRRTGINRENATWAFFGTMMDLYPEGCVPGVDYFWQHNRTTNSLGRCVDIFTVDIELEKLTENCDLRIITSNDTNMGTYIQGTIMIRTITLRSVTRGRQRALTFERPSEEFSSHGFQIAYGQLGDAFTDVRVYALLQVSAIIDEYSIPAGDLPKSFWIITYVQDPRGEGFRLEYEGGVVQIYDPDGLYLSYPDPTDQLLNLEYEKSTDSMFTEGCLLSEQTDEDNVEITLCAQRWLLTVTADPEICKLQDIFVEIPFRVYCNNEDPLLCPLDNTTDTARAVVQISTSSFCPVIINTYTIVGRLTSYRPDFSAPLSAFFTGQTVGFQYVLTGVSMSNIQSMRISYLAAGLGVETSTDLFEPRVYDLIEEGLPVAIILGADDESMNVANAVNFTERCPSFPRPLPYPLGCSPNVLRFTIVLNDDVWTVRSDEFDALKVAISVDVELRSGGTMKRDIVLVEDLKTVVNCLYDGLSLLRSKPRNPNAPTIEPTRKSKWD